MKLKTIRQRNAFFTGLTLVVAGAMLGEPSYAIDTGAAAGHMYKRMDGGLPKIESMETIQRVRIPLTLQSWTTVSTKGRDGSNLDSRIAQKPVSHVLRARLEKPNDFYVGDWRIQTTPIRWLKNTGQYQVRLELYRRYGESGQIEESVGTMNLTGILQKQADGLFLLQGNAKRRFTDSMGLPLASLDAGTHDETLPAAAVSKANIPTQQAR